MFKVKIFRGRHASTKIFYLEFFITEIFSVKKFPNYSIIYTYIIILPYSRKVWQGEKFGELTLFEHLTKESLVN